MDNIEIISAVPETIDDILAIQTECELSQWTRRGYLDEIENSDGVVIVARVGTAIAGFLVGRSPAAVNGEPSQAEIYNIGTRAQFRRMGVGSGLLRAFIRTCSERGAPTVWLDVRSSNEGAKGFYRLHGFTKVGTRKAFYTAPAEDADVMCLAMPRTHSTQSS